MVKGRKKPAVTVIMPSLNVINYIKECVDSVRCQSIENIEILCVDAGSMDGTVEFLQNYANQDERMRIILSNKKSYGYQVNWGIQEARGEYIAIVETDDYIECGMLQNLCKLAEEYQLEYIKSDFDIINEDMFGRVVDRQCTFKQGSSLYNKVIIPSDYPHIFKRDTSIWKGIYKKEFLISNGIVFQETSGAAYQDIGFMLQILQKAKRAMYVPESYYRYRLNRKDSSSVNSNVLNYVCQEFKWLFENKMIEKTAGVYSRFAAAFLDELRKLLIKLEYDAGSPYIAAPYAWIKKELRDAVDCGRLDSSLFPKETWFELLFALDDLGGYASYCRFRQKSHEMQKAELKRLISEDKLIIFGSGAYGRRLRHMLEEMGGNITAFADNNSTTWGQKIEGTTVLSPDECFSRHKSAMYAIASKKYSDEIYEQLCFNGIRKIYIWK